MAPRERRTDAGPTFEPMSAASAAALREATSNGANDSPYVPPTAVNKAAPPAVPETPSAVMSGVSAEIQAQALKDAAQEGVPFCEECAKEEEEAGESAGESDA